MSRPTGVGEGTSLLRGGRQVDPRAVVAGTAAAGGLFWGGFVGPLSLGYAVIAAALGGGVVAGAVSRSYETEFLDGALATVLGTLFAIATFAGYVLVTAPPGEGLDPALSILVFGWGVAVLGLIALFPLGLFLGFLGAQLTGDRR